MSEDKYVRENERLEHVFIARGGYRNFRGEKTEINKTGRRVFSIFLPREVAEYLIDIGWYVKEKPPYREGDDSTFQMDIEASYDTKGGKFAPPVVKMKSWDGVETLLNEETVGMLDSADIEDASLEIRPHNWDVNGRSGCKAYLQELTVTLRAPRRSLNARLRRNEDDEEEDF